MPTHRCSDGVVLAFARQPGNDNLSFAERVRIEIAESARAVGVTYSERDLYAFAAEAVQVAERLGGGL